MERLTTQRKYLNFSLFLAGLLQHTHEQIALVFARAGEAIETELGMSRVQHTGEADAVPRAAPTCAGLEHQHKWFYQGRTSWFLEPYQGTEEQHSAETPAGTFSACRGMSRTEPPTKRLRI